MQEMGINCGIFASGCLSGLGVLPGSRVLSGCSKILKYASRVDLSCASKAVQPNSKRNSDSDVSTVGHIRLQTYVLAPKGIIIEYHHSHTFPI